VSLTTPASAAPHPPGNHFSIALVRCKSDLNFGSIMRLAVNYQAAAVFLVQCRFRHVRTDTSRAQRHLPIIECEELPTVVGCTHVFVDFSEDAQALPAFRHPKQCLYIFGSEDGTLTPPAGKALVYVPTCGSMNLAVSVGVLLYDRMAKQGGTS
jgi:tRNA(Leu) C34 or U34 (ribose-2'-O)-methylase TrmL